MRYSSIREMDISNGKGIGVSLFVQGCRKRCHGCYNQDTWDFCGGKEWTQEVEDKFLQLVTQHYVTRFSILGGEPAEYAHELMHLIAKVKSIKPSIKVWIWSGYTFDEIMSSRERSKMLLQADYLIDGRYIETLKDLSLPFRGSSNQKIHQRINETTWRVIE